MKSSILRSLELLLIRELLIGMSIADQPNELDLVPDLDQVESDKEVVD